MKKSLFFVAAAALVLVSCNNDVKLAENTALEGSNAQKEIAFSTYARRTRRVAADTYQYAIDGTTFPTDLNMYVAAYQVEPSTANYFAGTQYTYNGTAYWGGVTKRYWPLSACYINFLAYANVTGTAAFNATNYASAAVITQTDNSSAQTDLMYAIGNGEVTQSGNTLTFPTAVDMEFKHAQAWMDFYVKGASAAEAAITINSITLNGAKYAGTYTITHTNYNAKTSQSVAGAWSSLGDAANVAVPGWSAAALTTSLVQVSHGLLVVPDDNDAAGDWTSFVINYTMDGKTYDYTYTPADAAAANVQQAKHYLFNITFTLHEIVVDASVADWTDVSTAVAIP
ncbi:MAG: fimbrillin family protein [Paludibacteraceae bacterium]|nr:fimbrillin family protein [Paludibacteraceae bacterium]